MVAQSLTLRENGPIWSRDDANAIRPYRDTLPYVGFIPMTPQRLAGCRIEPPVSVPSDAAQSPDATAAAEPPEDPPGTLSGSCGFLVVP